MSDVPHSSAPLPGPPSAPPPTPPPLPPPFPVAPPVAAPPALPAWGVALPPAGPIGAGLPPAHAGAPTGAMRPPPLPAAPAPPIHPQLAVPPVPVAPPVPVPSAPVLSAPAPSAPALPAGPTSPPPVPATGAWTARVAVRPAIRRLDPAATVARLTARSIDVAVVAGLTYFALLPFGLFSPVAVARPQPMRYAAGHVVLLLLVVVTACYEPLAVAWRGRTLGKYLVGLEVRTAVGTPVTFGVAVRRHLPSILVRSLWAVSLVVMLGSGSDDPFERGVRSGQAGALGVVVLVAMASVAVANLALVLGVGRSLYDLCGGTEVVRAEADAPLAELLPSRRRAAA